MNRKGKTLLLSLLGIGALIAAAGCSLNGNGAPVKSSRPSLAVRNLPAHISSIRLRVSGEGMEEMEIADLDPSQTSHTLDVPAGTGREFALTLDTGTAFFTGSAVSDLTAGETVEISITLSLESTRIIVPDKSNNRIVQIDDMDGTGWLEMDGGDFGISPATDFNPYEIEFDNQGRIYVLNNLGGVGAQGIIRLDYFGDPSPENLVVLTATHSDPLVALAVDEERNRIYYADDNGGLYRNTLDGSGEGIYAATFYTASALTTDTEGYLYIVYNPDGAVLERLDPGDASTLAQNWGDVSDYFGYPTDLIVRDDSIYVASTSGADGYKILRFDLGLTTLQDSFGDYPADQANPQPGELAYPTRFLAARNRKFYLLDEDLSDGASPPADRIIAFSDLAGSEWETYGETGNGTGQFNLFYLYGT